MTTDDRRIIRLPQPIHVRAAVHSVLTGHMAGHLVHHRIDLSDRAAARAALHSAGFGETSIATLLDRSIALAQQTLKQQGRANG
ncbi:hypothetical protein [Paracoccus sp. 22332]|uniref:hypothetical protein n=1 Tax=Paracoccus sp. 22332 TaxID=3453913 RepID=UPI003F84EB5E